MQSLRSKIIIGLIKNKHLFNRKRKRPIIDETFSVDDFRAKVENASLLMNKRIKDAKISPVDIDGIYGEYISAGNVQNKRLIMYIHGGGFISGSCNTHRAHVYKFAKQTGLKAILFDYRLAPEHPFPAALDDCFKVYEWLLKDQGYRSDEIVIAGESAGATLSLSLLIKIKSQNLPQPSGAVSISPVTDLRCLADSFERNATKDIAPYNSWNVWLGFYIGTSDPTDPFISPQFGNLEGLAPVYLCVGTHEIHHDDTVIFHKRVEKFGGISELHVYKNMVHAFPIMAPMFPEATRAFEDICNFITNKLDSQ